ncbi:MAG TPA: hypothetical protein VFH56_03025 [Acidimicrobiales bacterium]|nr:hypothetical protein [Acidimicrobiales bacterium]
MRTGDLPIRSASTAAFSIARSAAKSRATVAGLVWVLRSSTASWISLGVSAARGIEPSLGRNTAIPWVSRATVAARLPGRASHF